MDESLTNMTSNDRLLIEISLSVSGVEDIYRPITMPHLPDLSPDLSEP